MSASHLSQLREWEYAEMQDNLEKSNDKATKYTNNTFASCILNCFPVDVKMC